MSHDLEPSPEFRAHLEWEVLRAARRETRFGPAVRPRSRLPRVVALVAACLALGVAGNFASAQVGTSARRDSLVEAVQAEIRVATMRRELARQVAERRVRDVEMEVASTGRSRDAARDVVEAELRLRRLQSNLDEVRLSAMPPRNELTAPRVGDRDFVRERLDLEMREVETRLRSTERIRDDVERRIRLGVESPLAGVQVELDRTRAEADLSTLAERLRLRDDFLGKRVPSEQVMRLAEAAELRGDLTVAQRALQAARTRLQLVERQRAAGAVERIEVLRAEVEVEERRLEVERLQRQVDRLGGRPRD